MCVCVCVCELKYEWRKDSRIAVEELKDRMCRRKEERRKLTEKRTVEAYKEYKVMQSVWDHGRPGTIQRAESPLQKPQEVSPFRIVLEMTFASLRTRIAVNSHARVL